MTQKQSFKILTVLGARPQFVKAALVSKAFQQQKQKKIEEVIIHTGQHYDDNMSAIFFEQMQIPKPQDNLQISNLSHGAMTGRMIEKIETTISRLEPHLILTYGDTNSTMAAAIAAAKLHVPIAHVEAGLRSFNMKMPEEINRIITDRLSGLLFCPTEQAVANLKVENIIKNVYNIGDVMYDAALYYKKIARPTEELEKLLSKTPRFYLSTVHRPENTNTSEDLEGVFKALSNIAQKTPVILPLHPRTKKYLTKFNIATEKLIIIPPTSYFDMITLLENCAGVLTDSGGLQKEAYFFKKACVVLREQTEWVELVKNGHNVLTGNDSQKIIKAEKALPDLNHDFSSQLYGEGNSAELIVNHITNYLAAQ